MKPAQNSESDARKSASPVKRTGDQITLKSGKVLHGVKIVRQTSLNLVLEVIPGVEPLVIPAKQVASIKYGTLGPRYSQPGAVSLSDRTEHVDVLPAVKTSPSLIRQLGVPFTEEVTVYSDQDILNVLRSVSILSGVPIEFEPKLAEEAPEDRNVSLELPAGITMDTFLNEILPECAPWLSVNFDFKALRFGYREVEDSPLEQGGIATHEKKPGGYSTGHP